MRSALICVAVCVLLGGCALTTREPEWVQKMQGSFW